jgi:hypothetical protein
VGRRTGFAQEPVGQALQGSWQPLVASKIMSLLPVNVQGTST